MADRGTVLSPLSGLGGPGLQIFKYTLGLTTMALVYLTATEREANPISAGSAIIIILVVVRLGYSPVRTHVLIHFFSPLLIYTGACQIDRLLRFAFIAGQEIGLCADEVKISMPRAISCAILLAR